MNKRWLISISPSMYPALAFRNAFNRGIMQMKNMSGERLSPWKIPLLMLTVPSDAPHEAKSVFSVPHRSLKKSCYILRYLYHCQTFNYTGVVYHVIVFLIVHPCHAKVCNQWGSSCQSKVGPLFLCSSFCNLSVLLVEYHYLQASSIHCQQLLLSSVSTWVVGKILAYSYQPHYRSACLFGITLFCQFSSKQVNRYRTGMVPPEVLGGARAPQFQWVPQSALICLKIYMHYRHFHNIVPKYPCIKCSVLSFVICMFVMFLEKLIAFTANLKGMIH